MWKRLSAVTATVALAAACSAAPHQPASATVTATETVTVTSLSVSTLIATAISTSTVTEVPTAVTRAYELDAMYACHGDGWANLYQWARVGDATAGTLTIVLADGEPPLIADRTQVLPMAVNFSGESAVLTIGGNPTIATVNDAILTVRAPARDGGISLSYCVTVDVGEWNEIVRRVHR